MKILFLADNFPPERNAQASRVYERGRYWTQWGHKVSVITCAPNFPEGRLFPGYRNHWHMVEEISSIRVVRVKTYIARNVGKYRRIVDFLSYMVSSFVAGLFEERPDLIVATSPQFFGALGGCALAAIRRLPFVLELSDLWPESAVAVGVIRRSFAFRCVEKIELMMYKRAVHIVALTGAFKRNLVQRGVSPNKISVVTNGVELSSYTPRPKDAALARKWGLDSREFIVGYIGTIGMAHALDNILAAAALDRTPGIRFMFVGAGAEREKLIQIARQLSLSNVVFVPSQPKENVPAFWGLCDIAVVHLKNTPVFETVIPSKMFEAMAMGLPILLAGPKGEASELLTQSGAGLLVPPEDPRALLDAVLRLKNDRALYTDAAKRSLTAAQAHTRERQARDMMVALHQAGSPLSAQ